MKKLTILFSSMAMLFGVGLGVGAAVKGEAKVEKAEAATPTNVYFRWDKVDWNDWSASASTFRVYMWNGQGNNGWGTGATPSACTISGINYSYVSVGSYTKMIIVCYGNQSENWDKDGNKTVDLTIPTNGDYCLNINTTSGNKKSGDWGVINRIIPTESAAKPSSSTGRIVVNNSGSAWNNGNIGVRCWGNSASSTTVTNKYDATIYCTSWFQDKSGDNDSWYGYADIPLNVGGYQFVKLSGDSETADIWNYQTGNSFTVSDNGFACVYYTVGDSNENITISTGGAKNDKAYASLLSTFIQAYDTCSSSAKNGYGAYSTLNTNIFSHAQSGQTSASVVSLNGVSKTIAQHIAGMQERSAASLSSNIRPSVLGDETATNATLATVIITVVSLAAVGGFFFLRKKKLSK